MRRILDFCYVFLLLALLMCVREISSIDFLLLARFAPPDLPCALMFYMDCM